MPTDNTPATGSQEMVMHADGPMDAETAAALGKMADLARAAHPPHAGPRCTRCGRANVVKQGETCPTCSPALDGDGWGPPLQEAFVPQTCPVCDAPGRAYLKPHTLLSPTPERPRAWLSPPRPDCLYNLNVGERMVAAGLGYGTACELVTIINGGDHPAPAQQPDAWKAELVQAIRERRAAMEVAGERAHLAGRSGVADCRQSDVETLNWVLEQIVALSPRGAAAPSPEPQGETARREWVPVKDDVPDYWFCDFCTEDMPADAKRYVGPWDTGEGERIPETWACANCVENFLPETAAKFRRDDFAPTPAQGETEVQDG